jgi:site-specific recombinase XerD
VSIDGYDKENTIQKRIRRYRCHVAAEFLYATGMRIAEVATLKKINIDTRARLVYVPCGIEFFTCNYNDRQQL